MDNNLVRPPVRTRATPNITPFTYYDGLTYLEILEALRKWLRDVLVPEFDGLTEYVDEQIADMIAVVDQAIVDNKEWTEQQIADLTAYVDAAVQQIINDSIEVQDPVVAGLIGDDQSDTSQALRERFVQVDTLVINVADHGVTGDGVTNDTAALQSVIDSAPERSRIWAPPGYRMVIDSVTVSDSIILDFSQATVLRNQDGVETINIVGEWTNTSAVTGVGTAERYSTLTMPDTAGYARGDVVKVYSDDPIPFDRAGEQGGLMGELMRVDTVESATSIRLAGKLLDTMATNVRISKMSPISPEILIGDGDFTPTGGGADPFTGRAFVTFSGVKHAKADITITRSPHAAVSIRSCYEPTVKLNLGSAPEVDGYGISDGASKGGDYDITTNRCRHSFTDNTGRRGNITGDIYGYGRSMFARVKVRHNGGTANGSGIDTHSGSYGHHFYDCIVTGNVERPGQIANNAAYTVRSGNHTFLNCTADGVENGFTMWAEAGNLTTDVRLIGCNVRDAMLPIDVRPRPDPQQHWADNPGYDIIVDGGVYESTYGTVARFEGVRVYLNNPVFVYGSKVAPQATDETGMNFVSFSASSIARGGFSLDCSQVTSGNMGSVIAFTGVGSVYTDMDMEIAPSQFIRETVDPLVSVASMRGTINVKLSNYNVTGSIVGNFNDNLSPQQQNYTLANQGNKVRESTGGGLSVYRSADTIVNMIKENPNAADLVVTSGESTGGAFAGQILNILNTGGSVGNVRIQSGPIIAIGDDIVLAPNDSVALMWSTTHWRRAFGAA